MAEDNKGKARNQEVVFQLDEDLKRALTQDQALQARDDPTKFTLLENISDDSKSDYFTYYQNLDQVLITNDIETHARLIPIVFAARTKNGAVSPAILKVANLFISHVKDNQRNMSALKRGQLLGLIHAVRNDNSVNSTDKEVKRMFGK